jgi:hypothetical protein
MDAAQRARLPARLSHIPTGVVQMSQQPVRMLQTLFHADLTDQHDGEDYWVSVAGKRYPLVPHTAETLAAAHARSGHLKAGRANPVLTHLTAAPVAVPGNTVIRVHLRHTMRGFPGAKSETGIGPSALYIAPPDSHLASMDAGAIFDAHPIDYVSTAQTFLFHHPELINKDKDVSHIVVNELMIGDPEIAAVINNIAGLMRSMGPASEGGGWAVLEPFTPPDNPGTGFDGKTTYYHQTVSEAVQQASLAALQSLMVKVKNDPRLREKLWTVAQGTSVKSVPAPKISTVALAAPADDWHAAITNSASISGLTTKVAVLDPAKQQIRIDMENAYIRYLGVYIQFFDANGTLLSVPGWQADDAEDHGGVVANIERANLQYPETRFLGILSPMNSFMAVPCGPPGELSTTITFPPEAVRANILGSGLGTGANPWPLTPVIGGTMTGVFNLGVPALMLGGGAALQSCKRLYDIVAKLTKNKDFIKAAAMFGGGFAGYVVGSSVHDKKMNWRSFTTMVSFLFDKACLKALLYVESTMAEEEVAEEIPFAGWLMLAVNICTGVEQMAQTIIGVATSDWNITNSIATTITTHVTVHPDPRNAAFPQGEAGVARSLVVKMIYQDQTRPTVQQTLPIAAGAAAASYDIAFPHNTLGGNVKFEADFYVGTWLAGKATTGVQPNDRVHADQITMYLVEFPVRLLDTSTYSHARILTYQNDAYAWMDSSTAPTATIACRDASPTGNALGDWTGLALSQRTGMLGSSWQAAGMGIPDCATGAKGQLYAFSSFAIPGAEAIAMQFPSCGFVGPSRLIFDPYPPKFLMQEGGQWQLGPDGNPVPDPTDQSLGNYYVDPRAANLPMDQGGGFHLRQVVLDGTTPFDMASVQPSFGRFAYFPDSVCLHPSGQVIGVNATFRKLQIVTLTRGAGVPDADVPLGAIGSGPALDKTRPGLIFHPVAVACAYDGTVVVLEDTKFSTGKQITAISRLSAYDLQMKPVNRFFDADGAPSPWLYLDRPEDHYYLDMTIVGDEQMTYIYLLYYSGSGAAATDYNMAIYTYGKTAPATNPMVTTNGIPAARLAVDMWHSAYTLNFAMVTDGSGKIAGPAGPATGPGGRTAPSVSMWMPPKPAA